MGDSMEVQVVGGCRLRPFGISFLGKEYPVLGLADVAVDEKYRKRGLGKMMMERVIEYSGSDRDTFCKELFC